MRIFYIIFELQRVICRKS